MVIKNYKELCCLLEIEPTTSNSKKAQMKELGRFCSSHKEGQKIVIDKIYKTPLPKEDNVRNTKNYPQFKVDENKWYNKGVYMIKLDNQVYIGSTINFRDRFKQHRRGDLDYMKHTYELLNNGGKFFILHDITDIEDEELLRMVEYEYIKYFRDSGKFTVLNDKDPISFDKYYRKKQKYVNFKVREDDWEEVALLLKERGIKIC